MTDTQGLLDAALAHQQAGRRDAAEHLYRALLALDPGHAKARRQLDALVTATQPAAVLTDDASTPTVMLNIADDLRINVPFDLNCQTTYVLLEQEDWCDPAMPFVRRLIQPGMTILEVGANYGVYTLAMAKRLQGKGKIIALEPAHTPGVLLNRSIIDNGLCDLVTLIPLGLSDRVGESEIAIDAFGARTCQKHGISDESVKVSTLDQLTQETRWPAGTSVELLRIDASVAPVALLKGGTEFIPAHNPLILFAVTRDAPLDQTLRALLASFDMAVYRAIPGLDALVLFDESQHREDTDAPLTLFACNRARAETLRQRELLIGSWP